MFKDTLTKLEAAVAALKTADKKEKAELVRLVGELRSDFKLSSKIRAKQADTLSKRLESSVADLETTYPNLTKAVNEICRELASLGI